MPAPDRPGMWIAHESNRYFRKPRTTFRAKEWKHPAHVPINGAYAGLSPRKNSPGRGGKAGPSELRNQARTWMSQVERFEGTMPTLTLEEQLGQKLLTHKVNIKALIKSWEGTLTKGEFRPRLQVRKRAPTRAPT